MTIRFTTRQTCIRTLRQGDPKWLIVDGVVMAPRAGFEISQSCPKEYKSIIMTSLQQGYLKPVANIKDTELFWETFQ